MIETRVNPETVTPTMRAAAWLRSFEDALTQHDVAGAAALFVKVSFWRDLVSFTWNITTLEGPSEISEMLERRLSDVAPNNFTLDGEATATGDVTEAWFTFETAVGRGSGFLRLRPEGCWTLLTSLSELKGFEEKQGETREKGAEHGAERHRKSWLERKAREEAELGSARQPYCVIVGGGQGGLGLGARLRRLGVPTIIIDKHERPGDAWRKQLQVSLLARSRLVRPYAVPQVSGPLARLRAERQDRRLARDVREGHGT